MFRPSVYGTVATTMLNEARGFDDNIFVPRTQTAFNATVSYPFLAAARWAQKNQAADQVVTARISAAETRHQVALTAAVAIRRILDHLGLSPPAPGQFPQ